MAKILITGTNSFVGRNFIKCSRYKDVDEISLIDHKPEDINFKPYDVVLHLAAIVHQSKEIPESEYFKINRDLSLNVAERAKIGGVKHFIFLSTVKVYGNIISAAGPLNENSLCNPDDSYGKSKFEAEIGLRKIEDDDFIISIIRTPLVYGVGVKANMLNIVKLVDRFPILPLGSVHNKRSFTFVENLVAYIDCIIEKKVSGLFIAMDKDSFSTTDLVKLISKCLRKKTILIKMPLFIFNIGKYFFPNIFERLFGSLEINNSKTIELLKINVPYSTEEGIKSMVDSYKRTKKG